MIYKVLRFFIAVALLVAVLRYVDAEALISTLQRAKISYLAVAFFISLLMYWFASIRTQRLLRMQNLNLSTALLFEVNLATRFYGLFVPGGNVTGLLIRVLKLTTERSEIPTVLFCLFADRLLATAVLGFVGVFAWLLVSPMPELLWLVVCVFVFVCCAALLYFMFVQTYPMRLNDLIAWLEGLVPSILKKVAGKSLNGMTFPASSLIQLILLSLLSLFIGVGAFWFIARALEMDLSLITIVWFRTAMMVATLLPITIAGLGVREVSALAVLTPTGILADEAIAFSVLVFAITVMGVGLIGGLIEAVRFAVAKKTA